MNFEVGQIVTVVSSGLSIHDPYVGRHMSVEKISYYEQTTVEGRLVHSYILKGAPSYFFPHEIQKYQGPLCNCHPTQIFTEICFECMEKIYP